MLDLYEEIKTLVTRLNTAQVEYAVCGGLALAVYGIPRTTVDIDLLIGKASLPKIQFLAQECGYNLKAEPMMFAQGKIEIHRFSKIDSETGDILSLDLLLVSSEIEQVWKSRQEVSWESGKIWVVSREGLISLKSFRGSGQDLDDIKKLKEELYES
jgi:hypothetical protein